MSSPSIPSESLTDAAFRVEALKVMQEMVLVIATVKQERDQARARVRDLVGSLQEAGRKLAQIEVTAQQGASRVLQMAKG